MLGNSLKMGEIVYKLIFISLCFVKKKKNETHLGKVTVKGADWNGVIEAARRAFVVGIVI